MYIKYLSDLINIVHLAHDTVVFPQQHAGLLTYLLLSRMCVIVVALMDSFVALCPDQLVLTMMQVCSV